MEWYGILRAYSSVTVNNREIPVFQTALVPGPFGGDARVKTVWSTYRLPIAGRIGGYSFRAFPTRDEAMLFGEGPVFTIDQIITVMENQRNGIFLTLEDHLGIPTTCSYNLSDHQERKP